MNKREIRTFSAAQIRAAQPAAEKAPSIGGYAAVFSTPFDISFGEYTFRELIKPGAFTRALKEKQDVRCLLNHDENFVLARTKSGTLTLNEDKSGLHFDAELPDTTAARDLHTSVQRGDIDQCSFAFVARKTTRTEEKTDDGKTIYTRTIEDLDLLDVSVVTYPAYEETSCEARSLFPDGVPDELKDYRACGDKKKREDSQCECECPECQEGDCDNCSDEGCECTGCECDQSQRSADKKFKERAELRLQLAEKV